MTKIIGLPMLALLVGACGDSVLEYNLEAETISRFESRAESIAARDDDNAPLAMSMKPTNQIGAPPGVKVWNPESTLAAVGISNGDLIALVDGEVPSQDYGSSFAARQKPFASATEQYVDFVSGLLALRHAQSSVLLSVHHQYRTIAEREKYGGIHAKEATMIRIVFP